MEIINRKKLGIGALLLALSVLFTAAVRTVDTAPIGPEETVVGFSHINGAVHTAIGVHMNLYTLTQILGFGALLLAALFALLGALQLAARRDPRKVDREILCLGGLYVSVFALYAFFEKCIINYRPVLMPGEAFPEASFPSSHTMLACVILGSTALVLPQYVREARIRRIGRGICTAVLVVIVLGRLCSGVHWFTDIVGGVLYGGALLCLFAGVLGERRRARRR